MISHNLYSPWYVQSDDFPRTGEIEDQITFLLRYAILAPSSHNTQPWKFIIERNVVKILPDLQRELAYSDRTQRELYISLGCALGNLLVAADYFGFTYQVHYVPEEELDNVAVAISFKRNRTKQKNDALFYSIPRRRTNRGKYDSRQIPDKVFKALVLLNNEPDIRVYFISEYRIKQHIAKVVSEASDFAFRNSLFRHELSEWVRSNYTRKSDGMPGYAFGVPGPISLFASLAIRHIPAEKLVRDEKKLLMSETAAFLVISARRDVKENWLRVGKIYEYIALFCTHENIATSILAGSVEYDVANKRLKKNLRISWKPLLLARIGYITTSIRSSPRRSISDVLQSGF